MGKMRTYAASKWTCKTPSTNVTEQPSSVVSTRLPRGRGMGILVLLLWRRTPFWLSSGEIDSRCPLGPLLYSLVILELVDRIGQVKGLSFSVWYLDDGTSVGTRDAIISLFDKLQSIGLNSSLHLNLSICEIFWPSDDQAFVELHPSIVQVL